MRAARAAASTCSSVASGAANRRLSRIDSWNRYVSCDTSPTASDSAATRRSRTSVDAVDRHGAGVDVVEPGDQVGQRRLARARLADESGRRAGRYVQVDIAQRPGTVAVVTEADTDETHIATHGRQRSGVAALGDVDRQVQHREDPPEQRHRGGCRDADAPATP